MKSRNEYKTIISHNDYIILKSRLSAILKKDNNCNQNGEYIVRTLYFDNIYDKALNEKINGLNNKEKFRIRIYNNNTNLIKLEKKSKINNITYKESETITLDEYQKIINGNISWMKNSEKILFRDFFIKSKLFLLKPKIIIEYIRTAFIYPISNIRITFDKEIKSSINNTDLFNFDVPLISKDNKIIMEVKFDKFIPEHIKKILKTKNISYNAYSKYANNRIY